MIIKDIIRKAKPDIVLLYKSKMNCIEDRCIRELWGSRCIKFPALDAIGSSGGIMLVWNTVKSV